MSPRAAFLVLDIETSSLAVSAADILEVAIVELDADLELLAMWSWPPDPARPASARSADAAPAIARLLGEGTVVGHNVAFDLSVLARHLAAAGIAWRPSAALCTRLLARQRWPGLPSYRLADLAHRFRLPQPTHAALDDALVTTALFRRLCHPAPVRGGGTPA